MSSYFAKCCARLRHPNPKPETKADTAPQVGWRERVALAARRLRREPTEGPRRVEPIAAESKQDVSEDRMWLQPAEAPRASQTWGQGRESKAVESEAVDSAASGSGSGSDSASEGITGSSSGSSSWPGGENKAVESKARDSASGSGSTTSGSSNSGASDARPSDSAAGGGDAGLRGSISRRSSLPAFRPDYFTAGEGSRRASSATPEEPVPAAERWRLKGVKYDSLQSVMHHPGACRQLRRFMAKELGDNNFDFLPLYRSMQRAPDAQARRKLFAAMFDAYIPQGSTREINIRADTLKGIVLEWNKIKDNPGAGIEEDSKLFRLLGEAQTQVNVIVGGALTRMSAKLQPPPPGMLDRIASRLSLRSGAEDTKHEPAVRQVVPAPEGKSLLGSQNE